MCEYTATEEDWEEWTDSSYGWQDFLEDIGIEGDVWKCPYDALEDEKYCAFHIKNPEKVNQSERLRGTLESEGENAYRRRQFLGATFVSISLRGIQVSSVEEGPCAVFVGSIFGKDGANELTRTSGMRILVKTQTSGARSSIET